MLGRQLGFAFCCSHQGCSVLVFSHPSTSVEPSCRSEPPGCCQSKAWSGRRVQTTRMWGILLQNQGVLLSSRCGISTYTETRRLLCNLEAALLERMACCSQEPHTAPSLVAAARGTWGQLRAWVWMAELHPDPLLSSPAAIHPSPASGCQSHSGHILGRLLPPRRPALHAPVLSHGGGVGGGGGDRQLVPPGHG